MSSRLIKDGVWLGKAFRISALALALGVSPAGLFAGGWAHAIEAEGTAGSSSDASASGTGEGTSTSGQESDASAEAGTSPGGGGAEGEANTQGSAEQSNGEGSIGAQTGASVEAAAETQNGVSNAGAGAEAYSETDPGKKTLLGAAAAASTDGVPNAQAETTKNGTTTTSATATFRQPGTYYCSDACTEGYAKTTNKKSVSVAVQDDAYSLAVASKKSAYAKSGAYSDFSKKEQKTINKSLSVGAYAYAGRNSARANAFANALAEISTGQNVETRSFLSGTARSSSSAWASACVGGNCKSKSVAKAVSTKTVTIVKECDREERVVGFFKFPACQYRVVTR